MVLVLKSLHLCWVICNVEWAALTTGSTKLRRMDSYSHTAELLQTCNRPNCPSKPIAAWLLCCTSLLHTLHCCTSLLSYCSAAKMRYCKEAQLHGCITAGDAHQSIALISTGCATAGCTAACMSAAGVFVWVMWVINYYVKRNENITSYYCIILHLILYIIYAFCVVFKTEIKLWIMCNPSFAHLPRTVNSSGRHRPIFPLNNKKLERIFLYNTRNVRAPA